jgi:hypothetical protein
MALRPSGERTTTDCAAAGAQLNAATTANRIACSLIFPAPRVARHFLMSWNLAAPPFVYEL